MQANVHPRSLGLPFQRILSAVALIAVAATSAFAQSAVGSLGGRVTEAAGGQPLAGALVRIQESGLEVATDRSGMYLFSNLSAGRHTVNISYLGLPPLELPVSVGAGERAVLDARLGEDVVTLSAFGVSGQRAGQALALNQQRASDNLRSIVSADAAGRFPDQNAAESMQRITGVSLERDQGEGRFISIRGVDPDLNNTQLNGVNIPASEEDGRKVNLDVFPTDILDSIEVVKAITPDMDADAIGGSVNIRTQTAFSQEGRTLRVSAEGQYSHLADDWGYKFSGVWGDTFNDGRVGLLIGYSEAKRYFGSDDRETDGNPWALRNGFLTPGGDIQHREYVINRLRRGVNFSLDFRPTDADTYFVRGIYSHFSDYENRFRTRFRGRPANAAPTSDITGTITGRPIVVDLKDRREDNNVWSISAGGEHRRGEWEIDYTAAFARAELDDPFRYQPAFQSPSTSWTYDFSNPKKPIFSGPGLALSPSAFRFTGWALDQGLNQEDETSLTANFRRAMDWNNHPGHLKFGAKYRAKKRDVDIDSTAVIPATGNTLTLADVGRTSSRGVTSTFPSVDPRAFREFYHSNRQLFGIDEEATLIDSTIEDYTTHEDVLAAYAMGDLTLGRLTLISGIRVEHTEFKTRGWSIEDEDPDTLARLSASRSYTNWLPGVIGRFDFSERLVARASWTNTLARPKFLDSSTSRIVEDDDVLQGNPSLKPYRANNWDASVEFYPSSLGVVSVGVFHKEIRDFVFRQVIPGGAPNGVNSLTLPLNGDSASVTGLEADWQQQLTFLPSPLDGLGFYANFTLTDSESDLGGDRAGEKVPFLNQSRRLANLALSYEKYNVFVRVSANYRSRYLLTVGSDSRADQYVEDHLQVDLSANYKFSPRFTVYAEVLNLTNEPYHSVYNLTNGLVKAEYYSWSANVGVKLNF